MKRILVAVVLLGGFARAQVSLSMKARLDSAVTDNFLWTGYLTAGAITPSDAGVHHYSTPPLPPPSYNTAYAVGSITKVVTAALLALRARDAGSGISVRSCGGSGSDTYMRTLFGLACPNCGVLPGWRYFITLTQLATHGSGLPTWPTMPVCSFPDLHEVTWKGTVAPQSSQPDGCTPSDGWDCSSEQSCATPGVKFEYSNWGFYLLGNLLAKDVGSTWWNLAYDRFLEPLGMNSTFVDGQQPSGVVRAPSVDDGFTSAPSNPGGGLWATGGDMLKLLRYAMDLPPLVSTPGATQLDQSRDLVFCDRAEGTKNYDGTRGKMGLGWHHNMIGPESGTSSDAKWKTLIWWKGGTWGSWLSFIAFMPSKGVGVFVLTDNGFDGSDVAENIARDFLRTYL